MNRAKSWAKARDIMILLALLMLLCLVAGLWPILLLAILALFAYGFWALGLASKEASRPEPKSSEPEPAEATSERDVQAVAFGLLQRRITECVLAHYPHARWLWGSPNPFAGFVNGWTLTILLNNADGCRTATVQTYNLLFTGLVFQTGPQAESAEESERDEDGSEEDNIEPVAENYELIAFEWVEANILYLNEQCNSAAVTGDTITLIPASMLPHNDSWPDVCRELLRNGFLSAEPQESGIQIHLPH